MNTNVNTNINMCTSTYTKSTYTTNTNTYICPICLVDPSSHSFKIIKNYSNTNVYYTCPAEATNKNTESIIAHYEGLLNTNGNKTWYWVLDCKDFGIEHAMEINTSIQLAKLITKPQYAQYLKKIIVINANIHINNIITMVKPFLSDHVRNLIDIRK
jgi:uncharacterized protein CbrC (UPF0167 family)